MQIQLLIGYCLLGAHLSLFAMEPEPQEADQNEKVTLAIDSSDLALLEKLSLPVKSWVNFAKAHNKNEVHLPISKEVYDLLVPLIRYKAYYGSLVSQPKAEITQRHALLGHYFETFENRASLEQLLSNYSTDALIHLLSATDLLGLTDLFEKISSHLVMQLQDPQALSDFFKEYLNSDLKINLPDFMLDTMRKSIKIDEIFKHMPVGVQTLQGHNGRVWAVDYSPDGRYLAIAYNDRIIRIFDLSNGRKVKTLQVDRAVVTAVKYSPDGKYLASGDYDGAILIFDLSNGEIAKELRGRTRPVIALVFNSDGNYLTIGYDDGRILIFDLSNGETAKELRVRNDHRLRSLAFSPDRKHVATGGYDAIIRIFDLSSGQLTMILEGHKEEVSSVNYSPDGKYLVSGSYDKTILIWDVSTGETIKRIVPDHGIVYSVLYSPDGKYLASAYPNGIVLIWDLRNENYIRMIAGNNFHLAQLLLLNSIIACYKDNIPFDRCQYPQLLKVFNKIPENIIKTLEDKQIVKKEKMSCVIQ